MTRLELRPPRWVHVPFLLGDIALLTVFAPIVFGDGYGGGDAFSPATDVSLGMRLTFGFFFAIGVFMFFVLLYRIIRQPATLVMDDEGIYLNPAGVSLGHFRWSEIAEVRETEVIGSPTGRSGPRLMPAVALVLRDPQRYVERFPKLMSPLLRFRQAEVGTPLLLEPQMFGKRYAEILQLMREQVAKHQPPSASRLDSASARGEITA